jgi:chemosensory pili system protein ChpB (putative protein-glutamate methylesterase)
MPDQAAMGSALRVVLLARAGKAADNLADALRQAGAELLYVGDPANTDEAALRAQRPQAVLVALEPSIEASLDKLDGLLSDPDLTVIFDEADVAAHRAGWDAARWARHLAAKLRHDTNVLPPGTENDQDWQPSPGGIPKPAAAYVDADIADFAREAVAHADRVPVDGAPSEAPPALAASAAVPMEAALIDAIPSAPVAAAPPPLPPAGFELEALEAELLKTASPALSAPASAERAGEVPSEHMQVESMQLEGMQLEGMQLESMQLESMALESMSLEPIAFDAADSVSFDAVSFDGATFDSGTCNDSALEGITLEEIALDEAGSSPAPELAPMRFDDDAFFLEELSATNVSTDAVVVAPVVLDGGFDGGFDSDFQFDGGEIEGAAPAGPKPARIAEEVLSFEALIASSMAAEQDVPVSSEQTVEPPRSAARYLLCRFFAGRPFAGPRGRCPGSGRDTEIAGRRAGYLGAGSAHFQSLAGRYRR